MTLHAILFAFFPLAVAFAAASDLTTRTVPNLVPAALVAGFACLAPLAGFGAGEMALHLGAGALVLAAGFGLFALGAIGGGDAKLAAAAALWLGFDHLSAFVLTASLLGGALTLAVLLARDYGPMLVGNRVPFRLASDKAGVPYAVALAAAALYHYPHTPWLGLALG